MARAPQTMTEQDDDTGAGHGSQHDDTYVDVPNNTAAGGASDELVMVDVDDEPRAGQGQGRGSPDPRLNDAGEGTLLERRAAEQARAEPADRRYPLETKQARRARQREMRDRTVAENAALQAEVQALRERVAGIEPRLSQIDSARIQDAVGNLDRQITETAQAAAIAKRRMTEAMASSDPDAFSAAMDERDQAVARGQSLAVEKAKLEARVGDQGRDGGQQQPQIRQQQPMPGPQAPPPMSPRVASFVNDFRENNPWYQPERKLPNGLPADPHTAMALHIDAVLAAEGFNPATQDYWDELNDRLEQALPAHVLASSERQEQQRPAQRQQQPQQRPADTMRRGPAVAGPGDRGPAAPARNQVMVSRERKEALQAAGVLDRDGKVADKVRFQKLLRQYQAWDRENGVAQ